MPCIDTMQQRRPVRRLRRSSQRSHPSGALAALSATRLHPYQRRPLAPCPALRRSQHSRGMRAASRAAGIVMVEAMACGTPVVALRAGSVPEVVVDGYEAVYRRAIRQAATAVA